KDPPPRLTVRNVPCNGRCQRRISAAAKGGTDERHRIPQVTAQGGQGGLPKDRGGERAAAPSALEATEPRAEAPRGDGGEAPLRAGREGRARPGAGVVAGSPRRGSARGGAADRGNRPGFARRQALAAGREAPSHGARGAHQGGGRDDLAEDRAG